MDAKVMVNCQYYENYNVGSELFGEAPYWKPKGGHTFEMPIDVDLLMYVDREVLVKAIERMVQSQNSIVERFEYIDHEIQFASPTIVEGLEDELIYIENEKSQINY